MTRTLFDISEDFRALEDLLDGDTPDLEAITAWLDELGAERDQKLDGYARLIGEIEARAKFRKDEARRIAELARLDETKAQQLKDRLKLFFESHGLSSIHTARYRLTLAKNGGKAPLILDTPDAEALPPRFQRVSIDLDREAIREALDAGEALDFARLGERGYSLRIK
jgi:hypothetical protein